MYPSTELCTWLCGRYGFGSQTWMMWAAGSLAAMASISYPAISAFVSMHADADKQGETPNTETSAERGSLQLSCFSR